MEVCWSINTDTPLNRADLSCLRTTAHSFSTGMQTIKPLDTCHYTNYSFVNNIQKISLLHFLVLFALMLMLVDSVYI